MTRLRPFVLALLALACSASAASAQAVFGTFSWQMQPYCNSVQLTLISMPTGFTVEGLDDQCGGPNKGSAVGTATFNATGNLVLNFTIVLPSSRSANVTAFVSPANGEGTWNDGFGNTGTFKFFGAQAGLPPRPDGNVFFRAGAHLGTLSGGDRVVFSNVTNNEGGGSYNTSTGVYTVPSTGLYSITFSVGYAPGATPTGRACAYVSVTGVTIDRASCIPLVNNSAFISLSGATVLSLTAGNTITVLSNVSGGPATLLSSGSGLTIHKVR